MNPKSICICTQTTSVGKEGEDKIRHSHGLLKNLYQQITGQSYLHLTSEYCDSETTIALSVKLNHFKMVLNSFEQNLLTQRFLPP